jgi:SAM-dependent methyltransferase
MHRYTASSDWNRLSAEFSAWLPLIAPYGERLIDRAAAAPGMAVLDLACGTGEPGLTLAERVPGVRVTGADGAVGMVRMARAAGRERGITGIGFTVAKGERLPFADGAFDRVICRFGLMLFDRPDAGLAEIRRVTRPGGRVAFAVWSVPERVLCPALTLWTLERFAAEGAVEWPRTFSLSGAGALARLCEEAGLTGVREETYDPGFTFDSLDHFMERNLTGRFIEKPYEAMGDGERVAFRAALKEAASAYALADGRVRLPQEAIVVSAWRP